MAGKRKRRGGGGGKDPRTTPPDGSQSKNPTNQRPTGLPSRYTFMPANPRSTPVESQEILVPVFNHLRTIHLRRNFSRPITEDMLAALHAILLQPDLHEAYKKKKEAKLAALANDESADGTSPRSDLCQEEDDELFLQSTFINDRGEYFGVGSLGKYINEKRKYPSPFISLQEQLEIANRKIEQQAALQAEREAEALRVAAEQQAEIKLLKMVKKYLSKTDPNFQAFLDSEYEDHCFSSSLNFKELMCRP